MCRLAYLWFFRFYFFSTVELLGCQRHRTRGCICPDGGIATSQSRKLLFLLLFFFSLSFLPLLFVCRSRLLCCILPRSVFRHRPSWEIIYPVEYSIVNMFWSVVLSRKHSYHILSVMSMYSGVQVTAQRHVMLGDCNFVFRALSRLTVSIPRYCALPPVSATRSSACSTIWRVETLSMPLSEGIASKT